MPRALVVLLPARLLVACGSGKSSGTESRRLRDLEATVAALEQQLAPYTHPATPRPLPTTFPLPTTLTHPATLTPGGPRSAQVSGTGTPSPKWTAIASRGAPNVRGAPRTNNNPIGNLAPNRQVEVIGRSADNAWLQIVWDNNQKAWVASDLMTITSGDPAQIPVVRNP